MKTDMIHSCYDTFCLSVVMPCRFEASGSSLRTPRMTVVRRHASFPTRMILRLRRAGGVAPCVSAVVKDFCVLLGPLRSQRSD